MSAGALLIREPNPDDDFVLHGRPPVYTERRSFFPTNSDITTTTRDLSQHQYRAALYRDLLQGEEPEADKSLRGSLRSLSRHLRLVSNSIAHNLQDESVAKKYLQAKYGGGSEDIVDEAASRGDGKGQKLAAAYNGKPAGHLDGYRYADGTRVPAGVREDRKWLADSEWNTSTGHHVAFADNVPHATLLNRDPSASLKEAYTKAGGTVTWGLDHTKSRLKEAEELRQSVNLDMDLAQVPLTRFTRKDLMASEYFPVTMSLGRAEAGSSASRSRARSPKRLTQSAHQRSRTPDQAVRNTDNFRSMKRLEKLYLITSEAPAVASVPPAILSPYQEEIARLRLERLKLEEEHLKELSRLVALETTRGPKPKWYELKDTQFHFEASKNNDLLRTLESLKASRKSGPGLSLFSMSQPDLYSLRMREASFA